MASVMLNVSWFLGRLVLAIASLCVVHCDVRGTRWPHELSVVTAPKAWCKLVQFGIRLRYGCDSGRTGHETRKVSSISVFEGDEQDGRSYTVQSTNLTMAALVRAANLKKDGQRYIRNVKGAHLEASESQPGTIQLSCILGGYDEQTRRIFAKPPSAWTASNISQLRPTPPV